MSTLVFKVPKDETSYRHFLIEHGIEVIRDRLIVKRPLITEGDAVRIKHNGCICRVMHVHSKKDKDTYLVVVANKYLSFNDLVVNGYPLLRAICSQQDIDNYYE